MAEKREVLAEQLRALADDLRELVATATHDPKERARQERIRQLLYTGLLLGLTLAARRAAVKAWLILTGEPPPTKSR